MHERGNLDGGHRLLLARTSEDPRRTGRRRGIALHFQIKHLMYLTMWTAILLAIREPLAASMPEIVKALVWMSGVGAACLLVGLYAIALMMGEGSAKDKVVRVSIYLLIADLLLYFIFLLLGDHRF